MADTQIPSFFLLIPGPWKNHEHLCSVIRSAHIEPLSTQKPLSQSGDVRIELIQETIPSQAFAFGPQGPNPESLIQSVAHFQSAALIEIGGWLQENPSKVVSILQALHNEGASLVRFEKSEGTIDIKLCIERMASAQSVSHMYNTAVIMVGHQDGSISTRGMHHFGFPDAHISTQSPSDSAHWLNAFNVFQLEETSIMRPGHTFVPDEAQTPRVLERWPDEYYSPEDGCHNPLGTWKLVPPAQGRQAIQANPIVFMPSLAAHLLSAENQKGAHLTREEVDDVVQNSPCIVMKAKDFSRLEQERGCVDIQPELAWEQWNIVRAWYTANRG